MRSPIGPVLPLVLAIACAPEPKTSDTEASTVAATDANTGLTTAVTEPGTSSIGHCENFLPPIEPLEVPAAKVGQPYEVDFTVPGLTEATTTWMFSGTLPAGLAFDDVAGALAGAPEAAGTFEFSLEAFPSMDDPECPTLPASGVYTLVVEA